MKKDQWRLIGRTWELTLHGQTVSLSPRPPYCDRGHWQGHTSVPTIDAAGCFPRYYMDLDRAKAEMHDWLGMAHAK